MTFKNFLILKGLSPNTVEAKVQYLARLQKETGLVRDRVDTYLQDLILKGTTATYTNKLVKVLREHDEYTNKDTFSTLKYFPVRDKQKTSSFTEEEITRFFAVKPAKGQPYPAYLKWRCFFYTLATTGCRPSEIASLSFSGANRLDLSSKMIILTETKTVGRSIPITDSLAVLFQQYIDLVKPPDKIFDITSRHSWEGVFNGWLKRADITKRVGLSTYSFRRTFITNTLQNNAVLFDVQNIVGHKSAETTQVYYFPSRASQVKAIKKLSLLKDEKTIKDIHSELMEYVSTAPTGSYNLKLDEKRGRILLEIIVP